MTTLLQGTDWFQLFQYKFNLTPFLNRSVMSHLKLENKEFKPKTMLDFGTGVGAALWAAQDTFGQMDEVFAVEPSAPMNTLAKAVATKRKMTVFESGSSFRLRLPADAEVRAMIK